MINQAPIVRYTASVSEKFFPNSWRRASAESEIMTDPRVELVGPLPAAIQNYTVFTAGILASSKEQVAGQALIQYLTSPAAAAVWKAKGYERTK